jgi:hypothetical protein
MRYAYFADSQRLAVRTGPADVWVYDTQDHRIGGFSQQQGGSPSISFSSQYGTVNLASLPVVSRNGQKPTAPAPQTASNSQAVSAPEAAPATHTASVQVPSSSFQAASSAASPENPSGHAILDTIERLGALLEKGYITPEEFASKKADLLSRL